MITRHQGSAIISSLILLVIVGILLSLGAWQLSRMYEKEVLLGDIDKEKGKPASALLDVIDRNEVKVNRMVTVSGALQQNSIWLVDNRPMDGKIGYQVLVPVTTAAGSVLLDYGWVASTGSRSDWPEVELPSTVDNVKGVITAPGTNPFVNVEMFESKATDNGTVFRIQGIDIERQSEQSGKPLLPFIVTLLESEVNFKRQWQPVVMPPQKHLGYAIQWFGLAAAALIIGGIAIGKSRSKHA